MKALHSFTLQISQSVPTVGSQSNGFEKNADGSYDVCFAPKAPKGKEANWLQTLPGKALAATGRCDRRLIARCLWE